MNKRLQRQLVTIIFLFCVAFALVCLGPESWPVIDSSAQETNQTRKPAEPANTTAQADKKGLSEHTRSNPTTPATTKPSTEPPGDLGLTERSPAAYDPNWDRDYPQDQRKKLQPFPELRPGDIPPVKLYLYGGPGKSSYASIDDVGDFKDFYDRLSEQKPKVMARWKAYLDTRYVFT
ncbi:MAG TPA: hypothetical protein VM656_00605, partial [Pyrinomonadaceae bacterium]|nr:hypothetical protein [Pyrinomonadaceae bacterium]